MEITIKLKFATLKELNNFFNDKNYILEEYNKSKEKLKIKQDLENKIIKYVYDIYGTFDYENIEKSLKTCSIISYEIITYSNEDCWCIDICKYDKESDSITIDEIDLENKSIEYQEENELEEIKKDLINYWNIKDKKILKEIEEIEDEEILNTLNQDEEMTRFLYSKNCFTKEEWEIITEYIDLSTKDNFKDTVFYEELTYN